MQFYQELKLLKNPEISPYFLWTKLFMQVHLAFVEQKNNNKQICFGVSFPEYYIDSNNTEKSVLGYTLRIFSPNIEEIEKLNIRKWLMRLNDYLFIDEIKPIPKNIDNYLTVSNYRKTKNLLNETRRFMKKESKRQGRELTLEEAKEIQNKRFAEKKGLTLEQAKEHYKNPEIKALPFIKMKSLSNNNEYSIRILQKPAEKENIGLFNTYGLSSVSTVPHW